MLCNRIDLFRVGWSHSQHGPGTCFDLGVPGILNEVDVDAFFLEFDHYFKHLFLCFYFDNYFGGSEGLPVGQTGLSWLIVARLLLYLHIGSDHGMSDLRADLSLTHFEFPVDQKQHLGPGKETDRDDWFLCVDFRLLGGSQEFREVDVRALVCQFEGYFTGLLDIVGEADCLENVFLLEAKFLHLVVELRMADISLLFLHDIINEVDTKQENPLLAKSLIFPPPKK